MVRLVVPIIASNMDEAVSEVKKLPAEFDSLRQYAKENRGAFFTEGLDLFYEWRADSIKPAEIDVERFAKEANGLKGIFTLRHLKEAGPNKEKFGFKDPEEVRKHLFEQAVKNKFEYIDREINHWIELKDLGQSLSIASYHNFEVMPMFESFEILYSRMNNVKANVHKFAVSAQNKYDLEVLNNFYNLHYDGRLVAICMGEIGRETRLCQTNYFHYAPLKIEGASANGQFTAREVIDRIT